MKIIERHEPVRPTKRVTCDHCGSIFECTKDECKCTSQLGVMHDGLGAYNIRCPVCWTTKYFNWGVKL